MTFGFIKSWCSPSKMQQLPCY